MKLSHRFAAAAWLGIALSTVWAQTFPSKPITIIMPYPVGGVLDIHTRLLAEIVSKDLGQPLVIVNQPGGGGTAGVASLVQRAPDGYTLAVIGETQFRLPHLQKLAYDPKTDLSYIANLADFQYGLSVAQNAPWKTIKELLNDAKANPGQISFGSSRGSAGHVAILQLEAAADVKFNYIPFNGAAAAHEAAAAGHVNAAIDAGYSGFVEGGRSRLLATLGENRIAKYESVPTLKSSDTTSFPPARLGLSARKGSILKLSPCSMRHFAKRWSRPRTGNSSRGRLRQCAT